MRRSPRRFWTVFRAITAAYWVGLFILTHLPPAHLPKTDVSDKVAHFATYCVLTALLWICLRPLKMSIAANALAPLVVVLIYGAIDELTQPYTGRTCSIYDWYADAAGAASAVLLLSLIRRIAR